MQAAEFCFLVSHSDSGYANARLMQPFEPEPDLAAVWLGVSPHSRKVREIEQEERVTLAYQYPQEGAYVTLLGTAVIETDVKLRQHYWRESFEQFWPAGPTGDNYVLVKFRPARIELMNIARNAAPQPHGLRAVVLERRGEDWQVVNLPNF
jgi:general stress protein 26